MQDRHTFLPIIHQTVSGHTITVPAGAAGTVKELVVGYAPIMNANGNKIGIKGDTSLTFTSSTFDNEVAYRTPDDDLANGDYWVDYTNGYIHGKKKDTGTSITSVALKTYKLNVITA